MASAGNNPLGTNQLGTPEVAYGDMQRRQALERSAPMSGAPYSSLNAPRRNQRRAVRGSRAPAQAAAPTTTTTPASPPPPPDPAAAWSAIAAIPGISPLAKEYALRATQGTAVAAP